jgi:hypothetical protein
MNSHFQVGSGPQLVRDCPSVSREFSLQRKSATLPPSDRDSLDILSGVLKVRDSLNGVLVVLVEAKWSVRFPFLLYLAFGSIPVFF